MRALADQREYEKIEEKFCADFFVGLIFSFFYIFIMGTWGGITWVVPIVLDPFLLVLSTVTLSFFTATVSWRLNIRKKRKREGKF